MHAKPSPWYSIGLLIGLAFASHSSPGQSQPQKITIISAADIAKSWVGKKLPPFRFVDLSGNTVSDEAIKSKVAVLNMWSTSCLPCVYEMTSLNALVDKYAQRGVIFLALAPEAADKIKPILIHQSFTYRIIPEAQDLFKSMQLSGYPYHIIVDSEGVIQFMRFGTMNPTTGQKLAESDLPKTIEHVLK